MNTRKLPILIVLITLLAGCGGQMPLTIQAPMTPPDPGEVVGQVQTALAVTEQVTTTPEPSSTPQIKRVVGIMEADQRYREAMTGFFKIDAPSITVVGAPDCGGMTLLVDTEVDEGAQAYAFVIHNDIMGNGVTCLEQVLLVKYPQAIFTVYGYAQLDPARRADLERIGTKFFSKDFATSDIPTYIADLLTDK